MARECKDKDAPAKAAAGVETCLGSRAAYMAALRAWAADTRSAPEPSWKGPGVYRYDGYMDDDWRPMATLRRVG